MPETVTYGQGSATLEQDADLWKAVARFFQQENARLEAENAELRAQLENR